MTAPGLFLSFEGCEGSGKTTQIRLLERRLHGSGVPVIVMREPGGTAEGEVIRDLLQSTHRGDGMAPETELFLFAAARAQLTRKAIRPALAEGVVVMADRYLDSTTAYQGYGRRLDLRTVAAVNELATGGLRPDRTVLIDVDAGIGLRRSRGRQETLFQLDRIEQEALSFHERVRRGYLEIARSAGARVRVVDGNGSPEQVERLVRDVLSDVLSIG